MNRAGRACVAAAVAAAVLTGGASLLPSLTSGTGKPAPAQTFTWDGRALHWDRAQWSASTVLNFDVHYGDAQAVSQSTFHPAGTVYALPDDPAESCATEFWTIYSGPHADSPEASRVLSSGVAHACRPNDLGAAGG